VTFHPLPGAIRGAQARYARSWAGYKNHTIARSTSTLVVLCDAEAQGIDPADGGRWMLVCEGPADRPIDEDREHRGSNCQFTSRHEADRFLCHPEEWCCYCQEEQAEREVAS
jgi:hypothetical protein